VGVEWSPPRLNSYSYLLVLLSLLRGGVGGSPPKIKDYYLAS
jgi:hypothetical protein